MSDITSRNDRLNHPNYPRSSRYDARWTIDNQMGPHALWLLEWLAPRSASTPSRPVPGCSTWAAARP